MKRLKYQGSCNVHTFSPVPAVSPVQQDYETALTVDDTNSRGEWRRFDEQTRVGLARTEDRWEW